MPYQIANWNRTYENNKSRDRDRCSYVCVPNKQGGLGLARILLQPDGLAVYGLWHLIVGLASQQPRTREGWMTDDGKELGAPWTTEGMAVRWRREEKEIERALAVLCSPDVGWIKCPSGARVVPVRCPSGALERKGKERREGKKEGKEGKEEKGIQQANAPEGSNFQKFMDGIIRDYYSAKPGDPDPKEKSAVTALYKEFGGVGKKLLAFAKQDPELARKGFEAVGARLNKTVDDNWTMFAVTKHFPSWMNDPEGYEKETARIPSPGVS